MTGIIALGGQAGPFLPDPVHVVHVEPSSVLGDLTNMHGMLREQLALHESLVIVYSRRLGTAAERSLATIRAALGGASILWHRTALPPLAADVLVTLAGGLQQELGRGSDVAAALPLLERQLVHISWVASVSGLGDPAPTVVQHARSALPGVSWLVTSFPEPAIVKMDPGQPPQIPASSQDIGVALADLDGDRSWIEPVISRGLANPYGVEVQPPHDTAEWFGCKRVTQIVLYPRSMAFLAKALQSDLDPGECQWCLRYVGSSICPRCGIPRNGHGGDAESDATRHGSLLSRGEQHTATYTPTGDAVQQ